MQGNRCHVEKGDGRGEAKCEQVGKNVCKNVTQTLLAKCSRKTDLVGVEIAAAPKIRYEEADVESTVYFAGKNGVVKESTLADDLSEEWTIGEERPWWYFRL
jgi:hypothetical protein